MHTRQNILGFFLGKKGPCGKMQTRQTNVLRIFFRFFREKNFMYHKFSHLTTIFFIGKNSYFSYTIFFSHHNRIFSHHSRVFSHHSRVFSHQNEVFSHHSRVFSEHNEVFSEHKRAKVRGKCSDSS